MVWSPMDEEQLLRDGLAALRELLGLTWNVQQLINGGSTDQGFDAVWAVARLSPGDQTGTIFVDAKVKPTPAAFKNMRLVGAHKGMAGATTLVLAPWLSPRTREVLEQHGFDYLDLTGNVSLRLDRPTIVIRTEGARQDPSPRRSPKRSLSGATAGRLVRELVDYEPPRKPRELAIAAGVSESYVSRLLDIMSEDALIDREGRLITWIDWKGLLRSRGSSNELMKTNRVVSLVARQGRGRLKDRLRVGAHHHRVLMTGSFAAAAFAPSAVGGPLMAYVSSPTMLDEITRDLSLTPADQVGDADIQLLLPIRNEGVFDRPHPDQVDGIDCVGLSQLVLDCLSGPGRMPAEGEALLEWMTGSERSWRRRSPIGE